MNKKLPSNQPSAILLSEIFWNDQVLSKPKELKAK